MRTTLAVIFASLTTTAADALADEAREHAPLPEPILTETVTDIDGNEPGELELEANGSTFRARRGGAYALDASVEAEFIVHRLLGLRLEPSLAGGREGAPLASQRAAGVSGGAALKLVQDFERAFFLDAEVVGRLPWSEESIVQPGDPELPFAVDLRAAMRRGPLTVRWGLGVGAFGEPAHAPLRASLALLAPFEGSGRFGFWGVEFDADGARPAPFVAAVNIVPNIVPAGVPLRVGLALPWSIGERDDRPSLGVFVRVFYEAAREIEFARGQRGVNRSE
jgi:hypothetical protein